MEGFTVPPALIVAIVGILAAAVVLILFGSKPKREQGAASDKIIKKAYVIFSEFFLTSGQMKKISDQLAALSIYNVGELRVVATKYFLLSTSISLAMAVAGIVLFKDTVSIIICITFAIIVNSILVDKQIAKTNRKVYEALRASISSIRQEYLRLGSVPEAIAEADIPPLLQRPFDNIYSILTSANGEIELLKFYESSPFRALQTLAGICFNINNSGDEKDEFGQSNFVQALTMLSTDINSELERLTQMKVKFGVIEYLAIIPIFIINLVEKYFIDTMPGSALIYNGIIGYICRVVILISCAVCYKLVTSINSPNSVKDDDRNTWTQSLLDNKRFRQVVYNIEPKNAKKRKWDRKLKACLSKKDTAHVYAEKLVYSGVCLVFSVITLLSVVTMSRDYYSTCTDQLSLVADESLAKYDKQTILQLDEEYMATMGKMDDAQKAELIKGYLPGISDLQIQDQIARIENKKSSLDSAFVHWYYILVCYVIAIIGWFIPDLQLVMRKMMVKTDAQDDFLQLQTLMGILMNMNIDTLDAIWQMCQNSRIHKDMLLYCYHSFPSNPQLEIARVQTKTPIPDFKRFLGKLELTISNLSLAEAYGDLKIERDHMLRIREMAMQATINKKRSICGKIAMTPFILFVIGEFLIPIGYLGVTEFMKALGSMGG